MNNEILIRLGFFFGVLTLMGAWEAVAPRRDYDVTTGLRFHPIEIFLSLLIKLAVVALIGPTPAAVLIFEILLNATSMFNHGNVRINTVVDRVLRLFVVTPDMHRVHHSMIPLETDSNYGFNLPWWDRLFGTYCRQPAMGHEKMTIGLETFRDPKMLRLHWLLAIPFIRSPLHNNTWK
jgi:sterol desaturase/sphingolipid hydroxylase (fatty acid hydroxylase superfamily)